MMNSLTIRRVRHRTGMFISNCLHRSKPSKEAFVLSAGRDGSNLFVDYLNSIDGVSFDGELLNQQLASGIRRRWITKGATFRHIRRSLNANRGTIRGAKLHFAQLRSRKITLDQLHSRFPDIQLIVMYRQSLARQFVSTQLAAKTGQWLLKDKQKRVEARITLSREDTLSFYQRIRDYYQDLLKHPWVKDNAILFSYEELTQDAQGLFDRVVQPFLDLPPTQIATSLTKQNTKQLSDTVENYSELEDLLTGEAAEHRYSLT